MTVDLNRRDFMKLGAVAMGSAFQPPLFWVNADTRPNVLILLREGHQGSRPQRAVTSAPGIQQLAREGFTFENAIQRYPFGGPAWDILLTGQWPRVMKEKASTLAEIFSHAGYATSYVRDWQIEEQKEADRHYGFEQVLVCRHSNDAV